MYNLREDLFERDADESHLTDSESTLSPGSSLPSSRSASLSYSSLTTPVFDDDDDEIYFPSYENDKSDGKKACKDQFDSVESSPATSPAVQRSVSPGTIERPEDDTAASIQPSHHVDYLSHEWEEEDIWSSWKHLVSKKNVYPNSERLLNASWRTWEKKRRNLKTISPETVKWLKDHDVTWLYGPLQPGSCTLTRKLNTHNGCQSSNSHADCQHMKPILKKRSLSELMLRRSVSSASLLKDAATADAQKSRKLATSEYDSFILATPGLTRANTTGLASSTGSGSISSDPDNANKNVRFHDMVEQCIALAHLGDDEPEYHYVSDSDDEAVVMRKSTKRNRVTKQPLPPTKPKQKAHVSRTIEKLPHAPLKYSSETEAESPVATPDVGLKISPRPTQERKPSPPPSTPSLSRDNSNCDDEEEECWEEPSWLQQRRDSVQIFHDKLDSIKMLSPTEGLSRNSSFLHRPILERNEDTKNVPHVERAPTIEGRDACISFELLPCRSQLAAFSFSSSNKTHHEEDYMIDPADSDEEGWAENINVSPSSSDYFSTGSDNDSENSGEATKPASADEFLVNISPRVSSDSGYGSEEMWRVRDESQLQVEKEKGIKDWDLYHDWDEVDEAVAWQREF